ncbi:MAG: hypothetical protein IIZ93_08860 [Acidaminococcaceae bacterium]|nr:hypothetical protein [Acidaminococcaceae bacterium]
MSVYGDMLLYWPEQRRTLTIYDMKPKINGGWDKVVDQSGEVITQTITGIFQNTSGNQTRDGNGNLVHTKGQELWTETPGLADKFTDINGSVYRLTADNDWQNEGGFFRYSLNKVVGNNGAESDDAAWNLGGNSLG